MRDLSAVHELRLRPELAMKDPIGAICLTCSFPVEGIKALREVARHARCYVPVTKCREGKVSYERSNWPKIFRKSDSPHMKVPSELLVRFRIAFCFKRVGIPANATPATDGDLEEP